jgi:hypothetical protein
MKSIERTVTVPLAGRKVNPVDRACLICASADPAENSTANVTARSSLEPISRLMLNEAFMIFLPFVSA